MSTFRIIIIIIYNMMGRLSLVNAVEQLLKFESMMVFFQFSGAATAEW